MLNATSPRLVSNVGNRGFRGRRGNIPRPTVAEKVMMWLYFAGSGQVADA